MAYILFLKGHTARFLCSYPRSITLEEDLDLMSATKYESIAVGQLQYELTTNDAVVGGHVNIFIKPIHTFTQVHAK